MADVLLNVVITLQILFPSPLDCIHHKIRLIEISTININTKLINTGTSNCFKRQL
jgi:hypothetical protein